jgi:ligand-binding sensor domain-containing protein
MSLFRKKPMLIEALQFDGTTERAHEIVAWCREPDPVGGVDIAYAHDTGASLWITTSVGEVRATGGDWVIKGIKGGFYLCRAGIFEATHEPVEDGTAVQQIQQALERDYA